MALQSLQLAFRREQIKELEEWMTRSMSRLQDTRLRAAGGSKTAAECIWHVPYARARAISLADTEYVDPALVRYINRLSTIYS